MAKFFNLHYGNFFKIPRKMIKHTLNLIYPVVIKIWPLPNIKSIPETIQKIIDDKSSIIRYGDSEMLYIVDKLNLPYQRYDEKLASKLSLMLKSNIPNLLVGLPLGFSSFDNFEREIILFWRSQISYTYPRLFKYLDLNKQYYNANITRLYYGFVDRSKCGDNFQLMMKVWEGRDIVIVEGEKSRLGAGNDLFANALSVQRILAPAHHAFDRFDDLYSEVLKQDKNKLILVALGPTAKALAYDLTVAGYQALDIGNLDIEYEWFRLGVKERVLIKGKYTSEVAGGRIVEDLNDSKYQNQIIARIL